eukprot:1002968-Pyramimonas_sp.AAC.1
MLRAVVRGVGALLGVLEIGVEGEGLADIVLLHDFPHRHDARRIPSGQLKRTLERISKKRS